MQHGAQRNWNVVHNLRVNTLNCPSSPLPKTRTQAASATTTALGSPATLEYQVSSYTGVSGSYYSGANTAVLSSPISTPASYGGQVAFNGVIVPIAMANNRPVRMSDLVDGTSNIIAVGEQSDYRLPAGGVPADHRSGNHAGGAWSNGQGLRNYQNSDIGWCINITTVRHPINSKNASAQGQNQPYSPNNLFTSPHGGGAQFLLGDGSVRMLSENMNFDTLIRLADRADRQPLGEF